VVVFNVLYDRRRILRFLLLFYYLYCRAKFLAHQPLRCCYHQHVFGHQGGNTKKRVQRCTVSFCYDVISIQPSK
jgi:hypothetical protein